MMNFKLWLETTISQEMKSNNLLVDKLMKDFNEDWINELPEEKKLLLCKWLAYRIEKDKKDFNIVRSWMEEFGAFLNYLIINDKSKLNNPNYKIEDLRRDSESWHKRLAEKTKKETIGKVGPIGEEVLKSGQYTWVRLNKGYCNEEGRAMGHCGNAGARRGDNIYSLRNKDGKSCLTFIVNDKVLGESKGLANKKPSSIYHQQIVDLLLSNHIDFIRGGGYAPENNFSLEDLSENLKQRVLEKKPYIEDIKEYFKKLVQENNLKKISEILDINVEGLDNNRIILEFFSDIDDIIGFINEKGYHWNSRRERLPDLDDIDRYLLDIELELKDSEIIEFYEDYVPPKLKEKLDLNFDDMEDVDQDKMDMLRSAVRDGYVNGTQSSIWKQYESYFEEIEDRDRIGIFIWKRKHENQYCFGIDIEVVEKLLAEDSSIDEHISNNISFNININTDLEFNEESFIDSLKENL